MMAGLTPVAAAARGARGESRREGVEWTCADLMIGGGADWKKCTFNIVPFTRLFDTRTRQHVPSACIKHPSVLHENKGTLEPFSDARAHFSSFGNAYNRHTHATTLDRCW